MIGPSTLPFARPLSSHMGPDWHRALSACTGNDAGRQRWLRCCTTSMLQRPANDISQYAVSVHTTTVTMGRDAALNKTVAACLCAPRRMIPGSRMHASPRSHLATALLSRKSQRCWDPLLAQGPSQVDSTQGAASSAFSVLFFLISSIHIPAHNSTQRSLLLASASLL